MWFVIALVLGGLVGALVFWLRGRGIKVTWWELLIGAIGILLLLLTIQNFFGSQTEFERSAANMFLLVIGLPAIILLAVAGQFIWRRNRTES